MTDLSTADDFDNEPAHKTVKTWDVKKKLKGIKYKLRQQNWKVGKVINQESSMNVSSTSIS